MYVLLRQLARIRRTVAPPAPDRRRSMTVRHVDAGSCNACEHELAATAGPHYDLERHGLSIVASPRHADVLLVTGPVTTAMVGPLRDAYRAMPEPRRVAALGDCAIGACRFGEPGQLAGPLERIVPVDMRIPGCPPPPDRIAAALLELLAAPSVESSSGGMSSAADSREPSDGADRKPGAP